MVTLSKNAQQTVSVQDCRDRTKRTETLEMLREDVPEDAVIIEWMLDRAQRAEGWPS